MICKESDIDITEEALNIIAVLSEGAMRDALSILERCIQDGKNKIDEDKIKDLVGIPKMVFVHDIVDAVINCNVDNALITINKVLDDGKDLSNLLLEMIKYVKDILLYKVTNKLELYSQDEINKIKEISDKTDKEKLINLVYQFSELGNDIKFSTQKNIIFQAGIIKMCSKLNVNKNDDINTRVEKIEKYLKNHTVNTNQYKTMPITQEKNTIPNINLAKSVEQKNTNVQSSEIVTNIPKNNSSKISAASSNKAEEYWPQVVKKLKQNGKIVLYTNLMNTRAKEINDMTVGIEFLGGLTSFGKTILEKQENIKELTNLVSMASGKPMNIKYITNEGNINNREVNDIGNIARESDIPFNVID